MSIRSELFRHRSTLLLLLVFPILVWAIGPRRPTWPELGLGLSLLTAGGALRLASARCLGRGARVHRADARGGLVNWGPYAWSRNPLYVAAAFIVAGLALVAGSSWWGLLLVPGTFLVYMPVVLHEEVAIRESVGPDFDDYRRTVPRWLGWPRAREITGTERSPWAEVLRREKGLIPGLAVGAIGILLVRDGLLPVRPLLDRVSAGSGLPNVALVAIGLSLGAIGNSIGVERKRRKHDGRREAKAAAEAEALAAAAEREDAEPFHAT